MVTVEQLVNILEEVKPPKPLLKYFPGGCAPIIIYEAVKEVNGGKFHGQVCLAVLLSTRLKTSLYTAIYNRRKICHKSKKKGGRRIW